MTALSNGSLATRFGDKAFIAKLTTGTALVVSISGKLDGTINSMAISGSGHLEYTYNFDAAAWQLVANGLATGPQLPAGPLLYVPGPNASGLMSAVTSGTVVTDAPLTSAKDRQVWPLKGRVGSIKVAVWTNAAPSCDLTAVDASTDCDSGTYAACSADCHNLKAANGWE
jgi:hypothetical protein